MRPLNQSISVDDLSSKSEILQSLRKNLSLKLASECSESLPYCLFEKEASLGVLSKDKKKEFILNFRTDSFFRRLLSELSCKDPLLRAVGKDTETVFDMTMGFARDATLLAAYGKEVWACEQNPILFSMVQQALLALPSMNLVQFGAHKEKIDTLCSKICEFLRIYCCDSLFYLEESGELFFDVVYLDPMFSTCARARQKSKDMEFLKFLAISGNREELFLRACNHAKRRVVVKQALKGALEYPRRPSFQVKARSHRFDVFLM